MNLPNAPVRLRFFIFLYLAEILIKNSNERTSIFGSLPTLRWLFRMFRQSSVFQADEGKMVPFFFHFETAFPFPGWQYKKKEIPTYSGYFLFCNSILLLKNINIY